jgi:hypothetical protein
LIYTPPGGDSGVITPILTGSAAKTEVPGKKSNKLNIIEPVRYKTKNLDLVFIFWPSFLGEVVL